MGAKGKLQLVRILGEIKHNGRTYRGARERLAGTNIEYNSILLYNEKGKFIKRFCIDVAVTPQVGKMLNWANVSMADALYEAEVKAWDSLSRYKFNMFGYWSAIWVHLNRLSGWKLRNPWKKLVNVAKKEVRSEKLCRHNPAIFEDTVY